MFSGKTVLNCIKVSRNKALNGNNDCTRGGFCDFPDAVVFYSGGQ